MELFFSRVSLSGLGPIVCFRPSTFSLDPIGNPPVAAVNTRDGGGDGIAWDIRLRKQFLLGPPNYAGVVTASFEGVYTLRPRTHREGLCESPAARDMIQMCRASYT